MVACIRLRRWGKLVVGTSVVKTSAAQWTALLRHSGAEAIETSRFAVAIIAGAAGRGITQV